MNDLMVSSGIASKLSMPTEKDDLKFHPIAEIFPMMNKEELENLCLSMRERGFDDTQPIMIFEGMVLDGRNRYQAAKKVGVKPKFVDFDGDFMDAASWSWSINHNRRHLNSSQMACCVVSRDELLANRIGEEAQKRKDATSKHAPRNEKGHVKPVSQLIDSPDDDRNSGKTSQKLAEATGTNRQYIDDAKKLKKNHPAKFKKVMEGKLTITQAKREIKEENRESRRDENKKKIDNFAGDAGIPDGAKFATIVIDPPWDWGDEGDKDQLGRARPQYATMSFEQLRELKLQGSPLSEFADKDCHIYLWITNRSLSKGFALLDAWGFRYVTCLTWCKPSIGMGNYFRGSTEQILFGVKGSQPLKRKDVGTWFQANRGPKGHSSKPVESYELIESCSPGPYLEVFARSNRKGWTAWGAEA